MSARRWLEWTSSRVSASSERTDKTDKTPVGRGFVSFGGAFRTSKNTTGERVTLDDAASDLSRIHAEIAAEGWPDGAFAWVETDSTLRNQLAEAEARVERIAATPGGPLRSDWTAAVASLAAILQLIRARFCAYRERGP